MRFPLTLLLAAALPALAAPEATVTVSGDAPGRHIPPTLFGLFFEEINRAGDGGLYAELIENRSFEDNPTNLVSWIRREGTRAELDRTHPLHTNNPTALRFDGPGAIVTAGFKREGLPARANAPLVFSARVRAEQPVTLALTLEGSNGAPLATAQLPVATGGWQTVSHTFTPSATDVHARLVVGVNAPARLDFVSLMPQDTWRGLPFRRDLAELLDSMKPGFLRFPGGCFVEGRTQADAHRWKETIGDPVQRKGVDCLWGYHTTAGFGLHEFLLLCEALNAEPLYVINCGISHAGAVPMDQMQPFVQDALDLVEYARGPTNSTWGAKRAAAGHPEPFRFNYLQIGNENGHKEYEERYHLFHDALKAKYPDLKLVANEWDYTLPEGRPLDLVDEHYYRPTAFFRQGATMYDQRPRTGPRIYVGEYAASHDAKAGTLRGALADAAFLTGLERNSDLVHMASYAPLFCHPSWSRWAPNAIHFDHWRSFGKPAWHTQVLFGRHRGAAHLPTTVTGPVETLPLPASGIELATAEHGAAFRNVRITAPDGRELAAPGWKGWSFNTSQLAQAEGVLTRTTNHGAALGGAKAGDKSWGTRFTVSFEGRLPSQPGPSRGWKSGLRVNLFGGKVTAAFANWGGIVHSIEGMNTVPRARARLTPGQWHQFRVEVTDRAVTLFVDGREVVSGEQQPVPYLFASASRSADGKELIVKTVNTGPAPLSVALNLANVRVAPTAAAWELSHADPEATNDFDHPDRVAPRAITVTGVSPRFTREFPAWSLTVIRFRVEP